MSITARVRAFQLVLALAVAAIAAIAYFSASGAIYYLDRVQLSRQQVDVISELAIRANRFSEQIAELLLIGAPERPDFAEARSAVTDQFGELERVIDAEVAFVQSDEEREEEYSELENLSAMRSLFREIDRAVERVLLLDQQNRQDEAIALFRAEIENRLDADLERLVLAALSGEREEVGEADAAAKRLAISLTATALVLLGLLLTIALIAGVLLTRSLQVPIRALEEGTLAIEGGNLGHRIAYSKRDEFGLLARRFNAMAGRLKQQRDELVAARDNLEREVGDRTREIAEANAQLTRLDQHRMRFLGDVSHELRTPLTALRAEAEVALRGPSASEGIYRAALANIAGQAAEMSELIEDLLFLARSEGDDIRFDFRTVPAAEIVSQAVRDTSVLARGRGIRISLLGGGPDPGPNIRADPRRLKQALVVVLENAARYADPETDIEVEVRAAEGGRAAIRVRDRGPGIPQEDIPHVFDRFYRGANAFERYGGSGLGLSIARWIVERHDGKIDLSSTVGHGTEVRLSLPLAA